MYMEVSLEITTNVASAGTAIVLAIAYPVLETVEPTAVVVDG